MANVLVVDDTKLDRILVEGLLTKKDHTVESVETGVEALEHLKAGTFDLVVTDLVMPGMDGLALTLEIGKRHPGLPVILLTAQGNEEIAVRALEAGAASYVPKRIMAFDLTEIVKRVLLASRQKRELARVQAAVVSRSEVFRIGNDCELIPPLVAHLTAIAQRHGLCDEGEKVRIGVALHEALVNAARHGNLELTSELRETDMDAYHALVEERAHQDPYRQRHVQVEASYTPEEARFVIRDEGPGFDPSTLPDPRAPENIAKASGRGVLLMRAFMDEVTYNSAGNEVTLVKRR